MFSTAKANRPAGNRCPSSSASSRDKARSDGSPKRTRPPGKNQYPSPSTVHSKTFWSWLMTAATRRLNVPPGALQEISFPVITPSCRVARPAPRRAAGLDFSAGSCAAAVASADDPVSRLAACV